MNHVRTTKSLKILSEHMQQIMFVSPVGRGEIPWEWNQSIDRNYERGISGRRKPAAGSVRRPAGRGRRGCPCAAAAIQYVRAAPSDRVDSIAQGGDGGIWPVRI
jgi:hypothetical protein